MRSIDRNRTPSNASAIGARMALHGDVWTVRESLVRQLASGLAVWVAVVALMRMV
jgi:hypothetical protein